MPRPPFDLDDAVGRYRDARYRYGQARPGSYNALQASCQMELIFSKAERAGLLREFLLAVDDAEQVWS